MKRILFLFSVVLAPVIMRANTIQLVGNGYFSCYQNPPKPGFAVQESGSFVGQDNQGNAVSVVVNHWQAGGESTCNSSAPTVANSSDFYSINFWLGGELTYLNKDYTFDTSNIHSYTPGCTSSSPDVSCNITFTSSPTSIGIQFVAWNNSGTLVDLDLGGTQ
jgi:hypothetical protein